MRKLMIAAALAAMSCAGLAADAKKPSEADKKAAAEKKARIAELDKIRSQNDVRFGDWCTWYLRRYEDCVSEEECNAIVKRNADALAELEKLDPKNGNWPLAAGEAHLVLKRTAEALTAFERAVPLLKRDSYPWSKALYFKASALWGLGRKDEALAAMKELSASKAPGGGRGAPHYRGLADSFLEFATTDTYNALDLPVFTDAKPFPTPQEATYTENFVAVPELAVFTDGLGGDDARIAFLLAKLAKFGVKAETKGMIGGLFSGAYALRVKIDAQAPVDKPEGYSLEIGAKEATVLAREKQGALWGIVSFLQCFDREKKSVRQCSVRDWPDTAKRGFLSTWWAPTLEFSLFNKINSVDVQSHPTWDHRFDPASEWMEMEQARRFSALGLDLYYGIAWCTMYPNLPICEPRTLEFRVDICKRYAAAGAGVYFPFDDSRYPLNKKDLEKYKIGRNCDADHLNAIYRAVKKDYPDFKFIFCPPFYWGPDSKAAYPEDREEYLKTLGEKLDKGIDLYWTGPMVKSFDKRKYQVEWFTKLTGRKPYIFQNGVGEHNLVGYTIDTVPIKKWHYPEFYTDIAGFHHNSHTPVDQSKTVTQVDCLWNVKGFEPVNSIRRGFNQLCGAKAYDLLAPGLPAIAYFDKYKYGDLTPDILHEDPADLERKVKLGQECWAAAMKYNPRIAWYGEYGRGCGWAAQAARGAKNPPDFLKRYQKDIADTLACAQKEAGIDKSKGDLFFSPVDFSGGAKFLKYSDVRKKNVPLRFTRCLRGDETRQNTISFAFECDPFPPAGDYELYVYGLDDETEIPNQLKIDINGKTIAEGLLGFVNDEYRMVKIRVPFDTMVRRNRITITNISPGTNPMGTPWFMVNYCVLKKSK